MFGVSYSFNFRLNAFAIKDLKSENDDNDDFTMKSKQKTKKKKTNFGKKCQVLLNFIFKILRCFLTYIDGRV